LSATPVAISPNGRPIQSAQRPAAELRARQLGEVTPCPRRRARPARRTDSISVIENIDGMSAGSWRASIARPAAIRPARSAHGPSNDPAVAPRAPAAAFDRGAIVEVRVAQRERIHQRR
jgi:hypothetical protein